MKKLLIIGAGGFGREVLQYALDIQESVQTPVWEVFGFLDDNLTALEGYDCGYGVKETISDHRVNDQYVYICAIGDVKTKLSICRSFAEKGAHFINLVHPTALIGRTCAMGHGNIVCPYAALTADVRIGDYVILNQRSGCGHDAVLGDGCTLSAFCDVTGFATLGEGVFMGSHAVICPGVKVGAYAKIGAGSIVLRHVKDDTLVFGVPAKRPF